MSNLPSNLGAFALALGIPATIAAAPAETVGTATPAGSAEVAESAEIIVTGEKSKRTLQDTPASVAVTTAETIANQNLLNVYDILDRTPNLSANGNRTTFSIRGIDAFNVSGSGDGALASLYLDGAVLPRIALQTGPLDLYDISQVEVFRGPQSTVQGRNALAGAIIIRTADPTYEWSGRARALLTAKEGQRRFGAAVGGPILDDQIAFRIAGDVLRSDGVIDNITRHGNADARKAETARAKLLLTPRAIPGLRVVATYLHDRHVRGTFFQELGAPYSIGDRVATEDVQDTLAVRSDIGTLEASYDLGSGLALNAVTNYGHVRGQGFYDTDRSPSPGQSSSITDPSKTFQQEVRLNIKRRWVQGLIGAYFLRDNNRGYYFEARQNLGMRRLGVDQTLLRMGVPAATVDTILNLYGGNGVVPINNTLAQPRLTRNLAGFADLTFPITDRLKLVAGLRYDHETQNRGVTQSVLITGALPDPARLPAALAPVVTQLNALLRATAANATVINPVRNVTYQAWLPKVGATYEFTPDLSLTATAQRGYRAGGSGLNQQRGAYYEYNPEYTWNYELALRSQWLDRKLTINANAYYVDWKDQQVSVQLTPGSSFDTQVINAGKSRLYGAELEIGGRPTRQLNLFAGVGYSNTRFKDATSSLGTLFQFVPGNQFTNAPHWTLSGGGTWQHSSGLFVNVNANYRSGYFQSITQQPATAPDMDISGRTLVNAKVGWQGEHFGAFVIANNIFNVLKPTQSFLDLDGHVRGTVTDPRIIGLSFEGRF